MFHEIEVIYKTSDYEVALENYQGSLFIHVEVFKNSLGTIRELKGKFEELKSLLVEVGYENLWAYSKNNKFCKLFGATDKGSLDNGLNLYNWHLK